ncbi:MAG: hypothetical protein AAF098_04210 [Pseudomonadota bacterium]
MSQFDQGYSRAVAGLKVLLPLFALGLLSTLFLLSRPVDPEANLPFSEAEVEELKREQRVGRPTFTGMTADGSAITVVADTARPDISDPSRFDASNLSAQIETEQGTLIDIDAPTGVIDNSSELLTLSGGVEVQTSDGYTVLTDEVETTLDSTRLQTSGHVHGTGPAGDLWAKSAAWRLEPTTMSPSLFILRK